MRSANTNPQTKSTSVTLDYVLTAIAQSEPVLMDDVKVMTDSALGDEKIRLLVDTIEALRLSKPIVNSVIPLSVQETRKIAKGAPSRMSVYAWQVELKSQRDVPATVWIATSSQDQLTGLRFEVPLAAIPRSLDELVQYLTLMDSTPGVHIAYRDKSLTLDVVRDIASVYKIFVLLAVQDSTSRGEMSLTDRHPIQTLTPLSAGLGTEHIGTFLSLRELCRLMILRSDNTATDLLVSVVGAEAITRAFERAARRAGHRPTPEYHVIDWRMSSYIERAWSLTPEASMNLSCCRDDLIPAHSRGLGFFIPLDVAAAAMQMATSATWHPWPAVRFSSDKVFFKGGSAPGVQSGIWFGLEGNRTVAVAVNSEGEPFGMIEEAFVIRCGEIAFENLPGWLSSKTLHFSEASQ